MVWLVIGERCRVDLGQSGEPSGRSMKLGDGHRSVQSNHRVGAEYGELVVEGDDLRPVGGLGRRCVSVDGRDRCLNLERAGLVAAKAGAHELMALTDRDLGPTGCNPGRRDAPSSRRPPWRDGGTR